MWVPADLLSLAPPVLVLVGRCFPNKFQGPLGNDLMNLRTREENIRRSVVGAFDFLRHKQLGPFVLKRTARGKVGRKTERLTDQATPPQTATIASC